MKKSLFKEFISIGGYTDFTSQGQPYDPQISLKDHLQQLLSSLPAQDQLEFFDGSIKTLKTMVDSMKFESPSIDTAVKKISDDTFTVREKLDSINSSVRSILRDLSLNSEKDSDGELDGAWGNKKEPPKPPKEELGEQWIGKWQGKSKDKSPSELRKKFGEDRIKEGMKIEIEHTKDKKLAFRIACDHLEEDKDYYKKIKALEKDK